MHGLETIKAMNSRGKYEAVLPFLRPHAIDNSARVTAASGLTELDKWRANLIEVLTDREVVIMEGPLRGRTGKVVDVAIAAAARNSGIFLVLEPAHTPAGGEDHPAMWDDIFQYPDQLQLLAEV